MQTHACRYRKAADSGGFAHGIHGAPVIAQHLGALFASLKPGYCILYT